MINQRSKKGHDRRDRERTAARWTMKVDEGVCTWDRYGINLKIIIRPMRTGAQVHTFIQEDENEEGESD